MDKMTCQMTVLFEGAFGWAFLRKQRGIAYLLRR